MKYIPTWCCDNIYKLDLDFLVSKGIKFILSDLDNTLVPYTVATPSKEVRDLINEIKEKGITFIIVSNNTGKRVETFANSLDIEYISGAMKPFKRVIYNYLKKKKIEIDTCVLIGDQIMTDIKCANKLKCKSILTNPLIKKESIFTFFNRKIDKYYRKKYNLFNSNSLVERREVR
jgi:hypothetical protein